jgi:CMP-N-acetylneuraminic acid synthetase
MTYKNNMKRPNVLAVITARGGSKGIPGKNIKVLNGKPLLVWSIDAAKCAKSVSRIVVSSDDEDILKVATNSSSEIIKRPAKLATDRASSESVVEHVLRTLKQKEGYVPDFILLLQPTSPLRTALDIDTLMELMQESKAELGISVFVVDKKYLKMYILKGGKYLEGAVDKRYPYWPRQKLPAAYLPNGALYLMKTSAFVKNHNFIAKKVVPYVMEAERSVDIDDLEDFKLAAKLLKKQS